MMHIYRPVEPAASQQAGFTIIELLIATLIFSVILIGITVGVLSFTDAYYKGVNSSTTQHTTQAALDTITQAIQFSGGTISANAGAGNDGAYCIGNVRFDYHIGTEIPNVTHPHALWETLNTDTICTPTPFGPGSKELLGPHMQLALLTINPPASPATLFEVHVKVAYGDNDLFSSSAGPLAAVGGTNDPVAAASMLCNSQTGSQFCATSDLATTVAKRISSN